MILNILNSCGCISKCFEGDKYAFQEIEDIVGKLMKSKKNSNFEKINMEDFMKNFLAIPELVAIIQ